MRALKRFVIRVVQLAILFGLFVFCLVFMKVNAAEACTDADRYENRSGFADQEYTSYDAARAATEGLGGVVIGAGDIIGSGFRGLMDAIGSIGSGGPLDEPIAEEAARIRQIQVERWSAYADQAGADENCRGLLPDDMSGACRQTIQEYLEEVIAHSDIVIREAERAIELAREDLRDIEAAQTGS